MIQTDPRASESTGEIIAHRGTYYRNTRIIVTGMVLVMGAWFLYDGFVGYPGYNQRFEQSPPNQQLKMQKPHSDADIELQQALGAGLLPLGVILGIWFWYASRGAYRLVGQTLSIPSHPSMPLSAITEIDKSLWDRKGIAYLRYQLTDGTAGRFKLDDFVYERKPTDEILASIEAARPPTTESEAQPVIESESGG